MAHVANRPTCDVLVQGQHEHFRGQAGWTTGLHRDQRIYSISHHHKNLARRSSLRQHRSAPRFAPFAAAAGQKQAIPAAPAATADVSWLRFPTIIGAEHQVVSTVERTSKGYVVTIILPAGTEVSDTTPCLQWGVYRTSPAKWFHPRSVIPSGSEPSNSGMRTPMAAGADGGFTVQLTFGKDLAPLTLAFTLLLPATEHSAEQVLRPQTAATFSVPIGMQAGSPAILGPTIRAGSVPAKGVAVNFCVRSRAATAMSLCLLRLDEKGGYLEIALNPFVHRTGDTWHVLVDNLTDVASLAYGWRADSADISRFYPGQVMLDPYCRAVVPTRLPEGVQTVAPNIAKASGRTDNRAALLGSLACLLDVPEWGRVPRLQPRRMAPDDVILEIDVHSFTAQVPPERRGKLLGVLDRLQHIRDAGATTVMLTPVTASGPGLGVHGRAPLSFFAPDPALAVGSDALAATRELRQMVAGLHQAGLSVLLQVQYCFTGEGTAGARNPSSLSGLDGDSYYRGDVLNAGHAAVRRLIVDSLRHLALDFRFDGFCFLNAESCTHDRDGTVLDAPPLAAEIAAEPVLAGRRLIAAPANAALLPRSGTRGFPHWGAWSERNAPFAADILKFMAEGAGGANLVAAAERLSGSPGLFDGAHGSGPPGNLTAPRPPAAALNGVAMLGSGPGLRKAVDDALWNFPPHQDAAYGCASHQDAFAKSLLVAVLLARGTPCLSQDDVSEPDLARFAGILGTIRHQYLDILQPATYEDGPTFTWHSAPYGSVPDWDGSRGGSPGCNYLAFSIADGQGRALYVGFNNSGGTEGAALPPPPAGASWRQIVDTGRPAPDDAVAEGGVVLSGPDYFLQPKTALVLDAVASPAPPASAVPASAQDFASS